MLSQNLLAFGYVHVLLRVTPKIHGDVRNMEPGQPQLAIAQVIFNPKHQT